MLAYFPTDYSKPIRDKVADILAARLVREKFPATEKDFLALLDRAHLTLTQLRDGWGRPLYLNMVGSQSYVTTLETHTTYGNPSPPRDVPGTPVQRWTVVVFLNSLGPDGLKGTADDFAVADFSGSSSSAPETTRRPLPSPPPVRKPRIAPARVPWGAGVLSGRVVDFFQAVITNAQVQATNELSYETYRVTTNGEGQYELRSLPPGLYQVTINALGFKRYVIEKVPVQFGGLTQLDAELEVGAVTESVTVSADASVLQIEYSTTASRVISSQAATGTQPAQEVATPHLREYFPETLVWEPELITDSQGRAQLKFRLADNITTWKMSVIGSTIDGQIGVVEKELRAFQPFFAEHEPPRILTEGDEIALPVIVRNYLDKPQAVTAKLKPESWFALLGAATQNAEIPAGEAAKVIFRMRATASVTDGKQRVTALGTDAGDAVEKAVTVHPDGEPQAVTASGFFGAATTLTLNIPPVAIKNSLGGQLKIYPNLLTHISESLTGLIQRPHGCGEQTLSSTYPNLLLLRYEKATGSALPQHATALSYLREGYERLLTYRKADGGFGYWVHSEPDLALTAYALRFLHDARDFIIVDENVISGTRAWLLAQEANRSKGVNLSTSAYIMWTLAETGPRNAAMPGAASPLVGYEGESYALAASALAAQASNDKVGAAQALALLRKRATATDGGAYWAAETQTPFHGWGEAGQLETSALALQALIQQGDPQDDRLISQGLVYLLRHKDHYGVWQTTQATVAVLGVLLTQAKGNAEGDTVTVFVNNQHAGQIAWPGNSTEPATFDLAPYLHAGVNYIELRRAAGSQLASAQAVANYYIPWSHTPKPNDPVQLTVNYNKHEATIGEPITCTVIPQRLNYGGMLLAEIGLPPGAEVDKATLEKITGSGPIDRYDILPDRVVLYLSRVAPFSFSFKPRYGLNAQSAPSVLYDYYNPEARAVVAPARFVVK